MKVIFGLDDFHMRFEYIDLFIKKHYSYILHYSMLSIRKYVISDTGPFFKIFLDNKYKYSYNI